MTYRCPFLYVCERQPGGPSCEGFDHSPCRPLQRGGSQFTALDVNLRSMVYQPPTICEYLELSRRSEHRNHSLASSHMGIDGRPVQGCDVALISLIDVEGLIASGSVLGKTLKSSNVS